MTSTACLGPCCSECGYFDGTHSAWCRADWEDQEDDMFEYFTAIAGELGQISWLSRLASMLADVGGVN